MSSWPDRRLLDLFGIDVPIIQAPMAVSDAGGLGSLPCAQLSVDEARTALDRINADASRRLNLNFFCHAPPAPVISPICGQGRRRGWRTDPCRPANSRAGLRARRWQSSDLDQT
jgi:NAD(P)H-dependent flavin oxidoreductase YrpB (nitropropane dioxygenase family)